METYMDIQKTILSVSFLKQPTLCNELVDKYIEFTSLLASAPVNPASEPLTITIFDMDDVHMSQMDSDCSFKSIKITHIQPRNNILLSNIQLLSHISIEMCNINAHRSTKCTQCIFDAFSSISNVQIKSTCLQYFTKLFEHTLCLEECLQPMIVCILDSIEAIEGKIPIWIQHKLVQPAITSKIFTQ